MVFMIWEITFNCNIPVDFQKIMLYNENRAVSYPVEGCIMF